MRVWRDAEPHNPCDRERRRAIPRHDGETCKPNWQRLCFVLQCLWAIFCHRRRQNSSLLPDPPMCTFKGPPSAEKLSRLQLNIHIRPPNATKVFYTNCKFKSTLGNCTTLRWLRSQVYNESTDTVRRKRGERHEKACDLLLNTRSSNSGLIENAKPLLRERVGGWVPLQIHGGRELRSLLSLPSQLRILLIAPLPTPAAPAPSFPLFFSFLSEGVHFETHPLWWLKGPTS